MFNWRLSKFIKIFEMNKNGYRHKYLNESFERVLFLELVE